MEQSLFIGFFKDNNGDVFSVTQRDKAYKVDGTEYATGLYDALNMTSDDYPVCLDKLPNTFVKVDSIN